LPSGVSGRLVGPAAFKAVEGSLARLLVGSIPIHSRHEAVSGRPRDTKGVFYFLSVSCPLGREK